MQAIRTLLANAYTLASARKSRANKQIAQRTEDGPVASLVVVGVPGGEERQLLTNVARDYGWDIQFTETSIEALTRCDPRRTAVILCDRDLPSVDWRDAVQTLASSSRPTCVILLSSIVDDALWEEVVRCGGYDILAKPLQRNDVLRAMKLARSFWNGMMKMPAYSGKRAV